MKQRKTVLLSVALLGLGLSYNAVAEEAAPTEMDMLQFASERGCLACHTVDPVKPSDDPNEVKPFGPAYKLVAERYKGQEGAFKQLVNTVVSGSNPYSRHWKEESSGLAMPPNAVALEEGDAEKLVAWILSLADEKPAEAAAK